MLKGEIYSSSRALKFLLLHVSFKYYTLLATDDVLVILTLLIFSQFENNSQ